MFTVTRNTILNRAILDTANVPRKFLGRVMVLPRREAGLGLWARLIFEMQALRYMVALVPFVVAMFVWPDLAFPLAQAPLAMILAIAVVEIKLLRLSDAQRKTYGDATRAAQTLDALAFRARGLLQDIAATQALDSGTLTLVIEQSDMARVPPLTLVSVQGDSPKAHLLDLSSDQRAQLTAGLFDDDLTEGDLLMANQRDNTFLRMYDFEARAVSAHARLAARLTARGTAQATPA